MIKNWKKDIFTIPNILSLFRLVLIPIYVSIYLSATQTSDYICAAVILAISCLTDLVDGWIARKFNMISTIGKLLDPVADKATQFSVIICLSIKYPILWCLIGLFVVKEGFQLIAGFVTFRKGRMLTGALFTGKICTTVLFISLILMILIPELNPTVVNVITIVDAVFMLIAFGDYIRAYFGHGDHVQSLEQDKE